MNFVPPPMPVAYRVEAIRHGLKRVFEDQDGPVFAGFSTGKDSVALVRICEPWKHRLKLLFVRTSSTPNHVVAFARRYGETYNLTEIAAPDLAASWLEHGLPADILPLDHLLRRQQPRLQPWERCCDRIRTQPLRDYLAAQGKPVTILLGQRRTDIPYLGPDAQGHDAKMPANATPVFPIWDWSDDDVLEYLEQEGRELPEQYAAGVVDSIECGACPALLGTLDEASAAAQMRFLAMRYPDLAAVARSTAQLALRATAQSFARVARVLDEGKRPGPEPFHLARHEAGHAVVGLLAGCTIDPEKGVELHPGVGICNFTAAPGPEQVGQTVALVPLMAGLAGEGAADFPPGHLLDLVRQLRPIVNTEIRPLLERDDLKAAEQLVAWAPDEHRALVNLLVNRREASDEELLGQVQHAMDVARAFVAVPAIRAAIEKVATALLERGKLSAAEVAEMVAAAGLQLPDPAKPGISAAA